MKIAIAGGGISGLTTAYYLQDYAIRESIPLDLVLLEAEKHTGGKVRSEHADGFVMEWGPNGFLDSKPSTVALCRHLGIEREMMPSRDQARCRYIFSAGRLHRLPEGPIQFLLSSLISLRGKMRMMKEPWAPPLPRDVDETVAQFARRRLGDEACDKLIDPMISGVFAGDPDRLSLKSAFPRIFELERDYGGLFRAMYSLMREKRKLRSEKPPEKKKRSGPAGPGGVLTSFKEGLQHLTNTLTTRLGPRISPDSRLIGLTPLDDETGRHYHLRMEESGETREMTVDGLVLAIPAYSAAKIIAPVSPGLAGILAEIPYAPVSVVGLGYLKAQVAGDMQAFGFVIPFKEGRRILGTLYCSSIFNHRAPEDMVLCRTMVGGMRRGELVSLPQDEMIALTRQQVEGILGVTGEPTFVRVITHDRAIPQYPPGHDDALNSIAGDLAAMPGIHITGNALRGIGMNDCTREAELTARRVIEFAKTRHL